jgi:hypothetical protein
VTPVPQSLVTPITERPLLRVSASLRSTLAPRPRGGIERVERIYREIDVNIMWWDPSLPSLRGDETTVRRNLLTVAIRRNAMSFQKSSPTTQWGLHLGQPLKGVEWRMSSTDEWNNSHHFTAVSISGISWPMDSATYCFPNTRIRQQDLCVRDGTAMTWSARNMVSWGSHRSRRI